MKKLLLIISVSILATENAFSAAFVELHVEKENGELKLVNDTTKTGFIERGGKNYGRVKYLADPGTYTITGSNPGSVPVVQPASFEDGKSYALVLTRDNQVKDLTR